MNTVSFDCKFLMQAGGRIMLACCSAPEFRGEFKVAIEEQLEGEQGIDRLLGDLEFQSVMLKVAGDFHYDNDDSFLDDLKFEIIEVFK